MSLTNTDIQFKRSVNTFDELSNQKLDFGEPIFIDNTTHGADGLLTAPYKAYLAIGRKLGDGEEDDSVTVEKSPVFKAFSKDMADKLVFYNDTDGSITDESEREIPVNRLTTVDKNIDSLSIDDVARYYILCQKDGDNRVYKFTLDDFGIFINGRGVMHGAAWNDYAEFRPCEDDARPGQIVCDTGNGTVKMSTERLQPCAHIVSDTYGQVIGEEKNAVPIALAGRALVSMDSSLTHTQVGDCICAGPNGLASKMTRQEVTYHPDKIIGVVCEIPKTSHYGHVDIDGRVWVNVK